MIQAIAVVPSKPPTEYFTSLDLGCEHSKSCLTCPLRRCKHDEPPIGQRGKTKIADKIKVAEFSEARKTMGRLAAARFVAAKHGINERTVHRVLQRVNNGIVRTR